VLVFQLNRRLAQDVANFSRIPGDPRIVPHAGLTTTITVMLEAGLDADTDYSTWTWSLAVATGLIGAVALRSILWRPAALVPGKAVTDTKDAKSH